MKKLMISLLVMAMVAGAANAIGFSEDWENAGSAYYPTGWSHTGSGSAGAVTAGAGVGGSLAMQLTGEGTALDGYYRYTDTLPEGRAEFDFTGNDIAGGIHIMTIGDASYNPRFDLGNFSAGGFGNYNFTGGGYDMIDTGIAIATGGTFDHIVYEWYLDNTDYLSINGVEVTIPESWYHHRAYGGYPGTTQLVVGVVRFGVSSVGTVATWDNINVIPEPATLCLLGLGLAFLRKRK